ncbi:MAG: transporter substrate-binding domain-containing protein [Candidatus Ancillula sp.]|jgi:polar amino acid transport system substrate-binding protein|nr:transporter substrate-binding domain-containing protein [Candidatus Ancillula sp.]
MKKIITRLALFFAIALVATPLLASCGESENNAVGENGRTVQQIKDSGTVKIGVFSDKAPFGYVDADGNYAGYDVFFAERIAEDLGVKVEYVPTEAAARVSSAESKRVDIVLANFTVTDERAEKVDFTLPYMKVALGVVSPEDTPVSSLENYTDQTNKPLIVVRGTTAETFIDKTYPNLPVQKFEQYNDAQNALLDGRGGAWITDNTEAIAYAKNNDGFIVDPRVANVGDADTIAAAVTKGNTDLLNWLNDEIKKLGQEQFFHADYDATLSSVYGEEFEDELVVEGGEI